MRKYNFQTIPVISIVTILVFVFSLRTLAQDSKHYISFSDINEMYAYFSSASLSLNPRIQGHRGTIESQFPEETIPCFEFLLKKTTAIIEVDPRLTRDSVIIVFHDATLERMTNGTGKVNDYTYQQLQQFNLKNPKGELTSLKIPLLEEILDWARDRTVLILDKKDVPPGLIADLIKKKSAAKYVINTVKSLDDALAYFNADSGRMFLVSIRSKDPITSYLNAGIPAKQLIGSLGTEWNERAKQYSEELKSYGISCLIATASTYDKLESRKDRRSAYRMLRDKGIDIIESNYPVELSRILTNTD